MTIKEAIKFAQKRGISADKNLISRWIKDDKIQTTGSLKDRTLNIDQKSFGEFLDKNGDSIEKIQAEMQKELMGKIGSAGSGL
ncbi:hypothetical protein [Lentilactobacillus hilgardii]|uniref:Uncharacterized protein n=1 Tax=Lentilactobacillus hilgardii (strain ATCC 8290 / DSM 20176 / CCUG 30140 / JCM 1155 / KCTC 3500 / NBRC 15886 / NCIMB 8040 / NRRL B-1843 / 9) TaxID=1423757 RepID=C0XJC1_LENH9|nr:hypothetical protein [Lentilactobacillus hilgardii]EEI20686.1 hypothetical protein HMPREF0497_0545 [Lentilactobacillus buchneri ATCC 11577]EEI24507.1 hypothetical protein HMPREF0519_1332 [Lentilactobacillus hilgardii DSM 20176 = ATCC 8290]MCP9333554.1 hypothetical protein [Lentilactobacillus hilgardii]MCP9350136.1 hypothetical protein [Lentilactobacillus hilgardii]MCP9353013.1 hypothetical protein [Lentilactobacillus hilgardii]